MLRIKALLLAALVCFSALHCGAAGLAEFLAGPAAAGDCPRHDCNHDGAFSSGAQCQAFVLVKGVTLPAVATPAGPLVPLAANVRLTAGPVDRAARLDARRDWLAATTVFRERRAAPARAPDGV